MRQQLILTEVAKERRRQTVRWGVQRHHDDKWNTILGEEVGEAAREVNEHCEQRLREELIQVAAVAVAWIEDIDSRRIRRLAHGKAS